MKTKVYIDGYNLYYGVLKKSRFKWLDPIKLATSCCQISAPKDILQSLNGITQTKYFTAKVLNNSAFDKTAGRDQDAYHQALQAKYSDEELSIILGYHIVTPVVRREFDYWNPNAPHLGCEKTKVWHIEEKQTDVNIAIHSLRDAYTDSDEQLHIFISNDSDLAPLVDMLSELPHVKTGIIAPLKNKSTRPSGSLIKNADWKTGALTGDILAGSQLPSVVESGNRKIRKPEGWYGQPDIATTVLHVLIDGLGKRSAAFKWLEQEPIDTNLPIPNLHKPAIQMLDEEDEAKLVLAHAKAYVKHYRNRRN